MCGGDARSRKRLGRFGRNQTFNLAFVNDRPWSEAVDPARRTTAVKIANKTAIPGPKDTRQNLPSVQLGVSQRLRRTVPTVRSGDDEEVLRNFYGAVAIALPANNFDQWNESTAARQTATGITGFIATRFRT